MEMLGLDVVGAGKKVMPDSGHVKSWFEANWKRGLLYAGCAVGAVLLWSTGHEILVIADQRKRYGSSPVKGRHWNRTLVTPMFDLFRKGK
jgi:hypothetical protein